ncbi:MAG: hypothetical protein KC561_11535 [Myxococcales bacterium]|nr:hypothetical protein [Myxococcales bacterium]
MQRTLIVHVYGGLCNRLRTLISSDILAQRTGRELVCVWEMNKYLNCRFDRLFTNPFTVHYLGRLQTPFYQLGLGPISRFIQKRQVLRLDQEHLPQFPSLHQREEPVIWMRTCSEFRPSDMDETTWREEYVQKLNGLKPTPAIQERIEAFIGEHFSDYTVGVHIRRTDHKKAVAESTDDKFFEAMDGIAEQNPSCRFLLATDNSDTQADYQRRYGDRLIAYPKRSFSRASPEAIEDAYVDLRLLGSTDQLLGSFFSSFTEMAKQFRDIPLTIIK